jgi:hypothetical protein
LPRIPPHLAAARNRGPLPLDESSHPYREQLAPFEFERLDRGFHLATGFVHPASGGKQGFPVAFAGDPGERSRLHLDRQEGGVQRVDRFDPVRGDGRTVEVVAPLPRDRDQGIGESDRSCRAAALQGQLLGFGDLLLVLDTVDIGRASCGATVSSSDGASAMKAMIATRIAAPVPKVAILAFRVVPIRRLSRSRVPTDSCFVPVSAALPSLSARGRSAPQDAQ